VIKRRSLHKNEIGLSAFLILLSLLIIIPLLYVLIISISDPLESSKNLFSFISHPRFDNYPAAWVKGRIGEYAVNTLIVLFCTSAIVVFVSSHCAYGVSRFTKFKEVGNLYYLIAAGLYIPIQAVILPLFSVFRQFHLNNSLLGLIIVYTAFSLPLSMMLYVGFFKSVSIELEEAATIDGYGPFRIFWQIILPIAQPATSTVIIFSALTVWRDFFIPLIFITDTGKKTLSVGLLAFVNEFSLDWSNMCAAMVMQIVPIVILFLLLQQYFMKGMAEGALKG
jgi:ABC-type glycerol-3-phosphate transport system permease component